MQQTNCNCWYIYFILSNKWTRCNINLVEWIVIQRKRSRRGGFTLYSNLFGLICFVLFLFFFCWQTIPFHIYFPFHGNSSSLVWFISIVITRHLDDIHISWMLNMFNLQVNYANGLIPLIVTDRYYQMIALPPIEIYIAIWIGGSDSWVLLWYLLFL